MRTVRWYLCCCFLHLSMVSFGQYYHFKNYTVKDGIAQSQVYALLQDSRGYLWMGTRGGGLTRYDGISFVTFTEKDGLGNNYINCIQEDKDGDLWIGTNNGISHYDGLRFTHFKPTDSDGKFQVLTMVWDKDGKMYVGGNKGLYQFDGKEFQYLNKKLGLESKTVNALLFDQNQELWLGYGSGLYKFSNKKGKWHKTDFGKENRYMRNAITTLAQGKNGNIWIGTYGDGMYCFNGKEFYRVDLQKELYKQTVLDIYIDHNQDIWIATLTRGVAHYNAKDKSFTWFTDKEGLSNNHVRSICQDNSYSYWFGTSGGGVANYGGKQFTAYDEDAGLAANFIYSVFRDSKGRMWVGNGQKGVTMIDGNTFTNFHSGNLFENVKVKSITEDTSGNVYFGTDGQGIYKYDGEAFENIPAFKKHYIRDIKTDREGNLWVATAGSGIVKWNGKLLARFMVSDGILQNRVNCLHIDKMDRIWYGTEENGVGYIFHDKASKNYIREKDGLSSHAIRSLCEDKQGNLWIGTAGSGVNSVSIYKSDFTINAYTIKQGLTSGNVYLITVDAKGNLVVGTEKGIDRIQFTPSMVIKNIKHYGKGEGFTGIETCQNAVFNDRDETLWFGTINGLFHYNPAYLQRNNYEPITQIRDIKLFYIPIQKTVYKDKIKAWNHVSYLKLPFDQNHVSFDFFAINFSNSEAVHYKWKLAGFDDHWSPITTEHSMVYSNLNPGKYTFLLKACNEDGVWNKKPVRFSFEIAVPYWKTWWFYTMDLVSAFLVLFLIFRWRINSVRKKAKEREEKISIEKEMMELEQKALRLQMNPHFIFNALNSIQSQIGTGKEKEARYFLAKFSRLMRQILTNSRNASITLEEEVSTLENYLLIEKFCNGDRFDYSIKIDEQLESDFILLPPMLLQPFVENAIKHGFKFPADSGKKGYIEVSFFQDGENIICQVKDNGIGREKANEINENSKESYHESTALKVTQERLELLRKDKLTAHLHIEDLFDEQGAAAGTLIQISIPITH